MATRPKIEIIKQSEVEKIIQAAYDLLWKMGVKIKDEEILKIYEKGGARVDYAKEKAYLDADLIDKCLKTTPNGFSVWSQDLSIEARLEGDNIHYAAGSMPVNLLDSKTEIIREPTIKDLVDINHLIETLEHIDFQTAPILPSASIPAPIQDVFRFFINMTNSNKPYFGGALSVDGMRLQIEMLKILRGGAEALKKQPRVIFAANPSAPLSWGPVIAHNLVDSAKASIPVMLIPMPLPGGTVPVTLAGVLTEHTAENLSGLVLAQIVNPGTPVLYGGGALLLDMKTGMSCIGAVESHMLGSGYTRIGKYLNLPTASNIGQSDSQRVDTQAGLESGMGMLTAAFSGINLSRGAGMLNFANCQSFEKLVIDNNICGMAKRMVKGIEITPETIAVEEILTINHSGQGHLLTDHTRKHFKQELFFPSQVINRKAGTPGVKTSTAFERAAQEVAIRMTEKYVNPIQKKTVDELYNLVDTYAKSKGIDTLPRIG